MEKRQKLTRLLNDLEQISKAILNITNDSRPLLNGEHFITDSELSQRLKLSRRTLQQWRNDGIISYFQVGGKVLYRESDVQELLERYYYKSFTL